MVEHDRTGIGPFGAAVAIDVPHQHHAPCGRTLRLRRGRPRPPPTRDARARQLSARDSFSDRSSRMNIRAGGVGPRRPVADRRCDLLVDDNRYADTVVVAARPILCRHHRPRGRPANGRRREPRNASSPMLHGHSRHWRPQHLHLSITKPTQIERLQIWSSESDAGQV